MAITTTPGSSSANAYISTTDATTLAATLHPSSVWDNNSAKQEASLKQAAKDIDLYLLNRGFRPLLCGYYDQYLVYPFAGWEWTTDFPQGHYVCVTADSGTTTTVVDDNLKYHQTNAFTGGSLYIDYVSDYAAPIYEIQPISTFNRSTYTVTVSSAFSTAIPAGSNCYVIRPIPSWLKLANVQQAIYRLGDVGGGRDNFNKGEVSKSSGQGGSSSYRDTGFTGHLSKDVLNLINANVNGRLRLVRS